MTNTEHHLICLGLLAQIYQEQLDRPGTRLAIEQAVDSAETELLLPVSGERLRNGLPISILCDN